MKTIKIIDLLTKIANGEEVPKKIRIRGSEFEYYGNSSIERYYKSSNDTNWMACIDIRPFDEAEILDEEDEEDEFEDIKLISSICFGDAKDVANLINSINKAIINQRKIIERLKED